MTLENVDFLLDVHAMRIKPVVASFVGIVSVKSAAVMDCELKVKTATASSSVSVDLLLMSNAASNAPLEVKAVHVTFADGVQNAVVPLDEGTVALVSSFPFAV